MNRLWLVVGVFFLFIAIGVALTYPVTAFFVRVDCYTDHWSNPNSDMNPNSVNWNECERHTGWPYSFFSKEK
jgi:outer membrane phospholipase A